MIKLTSFAANALRSELPRTFDDVTCVEGDLDPFVDVRGVEELVGKFGLL